MKEQEIGELYKEKLSGYEAKPSPAVWDGIANAVRRCGTALRMPLR